MSAWSTLSTKSMPSIVSIESITSNFSHRGNPLTPFQRGERSRVFALRDGSKLPHREASTVCRTPAARTVHSYQTKGETILTVSPNCVVCNLLLSDRGDKHPCSKLVVNDKESARKAFDHLQPLHYSIHTGFFFHLLGDKPLQVRKRGGVLFGSGKHN